MNGTTQPSDAALTVQHDQWRAILQWPIAIFSDTDEFGHVDCDYCGTELWSAEVITNEPAKRYESGTTLDFLYRAVSAHRMDGCPDAPVNGD